METIDTTKIPVGVVGLGLMGCSITTCLLMAGHPVVAVAPLPADLEHAAKRIQDHLTRSVEHGLVKQQPGYYLQQLIITEDYSLLKDCGVVIECTLESEIIKQSVYNKIEAVIGSDAILTSNTSAIPISILQKLTLHPERFFGLHWAEPSHTTRFLEIICGELSDPVKAEFLYNLSHQWGKEPTLVRKDIRGFITNRLMYAMYREAMNLVENGYATVEDVDRACRNNTGYWMTLVGVFRWMDLTGVPAYHTVMKDLFPTLHNGTEVPELIDKIVREGGKGVANAHGFYNYTPEEAKLWEETFTEFSYEIRQLALKYPADVVEKKLKAKNNK
ncbi:3-hydroxyacyl-CoA dehydrogenase family protein [Ferruginibacter paludis]|uniref:3-hydroxyacyl-CoA dehydrogenase family protein n=1 Tax=Ferruginibacter paludis TaxID=1310417 RepID=UPI0025B4E2E7|nr:3-hydroxyacyl-CoA dehydrogenase family protein [Ferruginibacter paludis]MDN3657922.1 3-hydroxyacyl-CoA dehydrogenase family protein [Ferruginibacter paludis]